MTDIVDNSHSSGKSIFEEKECVEIAEYGDQFCVKFIGYCDTKSDASIGGRKRKSRRKKSRKYLRRKRRRESRRKELKKRIRKSKKKLLV